MFSSKFNSATIVSLKNHFYAFGLLMQCIYLVLHGLIFSIIFFFSRTAPPKSTLPISSPGTNASASTRFPRNTTGRSTFHGIRDRRHVANYGGTSPVPSHAQDTSAMGQSGRMSFLNKLTSKFSRRYSSILLISTARLLSCIKCQLYYMYQEMQDSNCVSMKHSKLATNVQ